MATSEPLDILLAHNHWATRNLLEACRALSREQFHQRFEMGPGSLHDTLTHVIGVMRGWTDLLLDRDIRLRLDEQERSIDELLGLLDEFADELQRAAKAHPTDDILEGEFMSRPYRFTRGGVVTHVTTHGMHHRAQCMNMLRQLGVESFPPGSVMEWMLMVDAR